MAQAPYYSRLEVSNSDLTMLSHMLEPADLPDSTHAFAFGRLIDCMITEPERVDYYHRRLFDDEYEYTDDDFERCVEMRRAFEADRFCHNLRTASVGQKEMTAYREDLDLHGVPFKMHVRCKWDLWSDLLGWGGDVKSTTATTQEQFEEAVRYFEYNRQRAWYMDIAHSDQDYLIGISKTNFKIFKVHIVRGDELFNAGRERYLNLAYRWYELFGEDKSGYLEAINNRRIDNETEQDF